MKFQPNRQFKRQCLALVAGAALFIAPMLNQVVVADPGMAAQGRPHAERLFKALNLSETQKSQVKAIHAKYKDQRDRVLTADQKAKLTAARAAAEANRPQPGQMRDKAARKARREEMKSLRASLNLTDAQQSQMKTLREAEMAEMKSVLTPAQQQRLEQLKAQRQGGR
jgi:periplasmic protein CpxP/Spy